MRTVFILFFIMALCGGGAERLKKMNNLRAEPANARIDLACAQSGKTMDADRIKALYARMGEIEAEIFLTRRDYATYIQSVLSEEQLHMLDQGRRGRLPRKRQ